MFDESDLSPDTTELALVYNSRPWFALIGTITTLEARRRRAWGASLPRPAWIIDQRHLQRPSLPPSAPPERL